MIITCDHCKTRFRLDDGAVTRDVFRVKCSRCEHVFTAYRHPPEHEAPVELAAASALGEDGRTEQERRRRVVTVCNQKGGVAKTTTALNLGVCIADTGRKVLLVDFDVQANLSVLLGCRNARSFFDVLESGGDRDLPKAILRVRPNVWLLPSNSRMALSSKKYLHQKGFEQILRDHLARVQAFFDFILIDTPPSIDFFTINALMASDTAIIPTQSEYLAMNGVQHVENMIRVIGERTGHRVDLRVLLTMFEPESTVARVIQARLQQRLGNALFATHIERDPRVQESQIVRSPVVHYEQDAPSARQYRALAAELLAL